MTYYYYYPTNTILGGARPNTDIGVKRFWYCSTNILLLTKYTVYRNTFGPTVANQYIGQTLIETKNQDLLLLLWLLFKKNLSQLHESAVLNRWSSPLSKENVTYSMWLSSQIPNSHDDLVVECFLSLYKAFHLNEGSTACHLCAHLYQTIFSYRLS